MLVAPSGPTFAEPAVGREPDHAPDAEHRRTLVAAQVSRDCPPALTLVGVAVNDSVGWLAANVEAAAHSSRPPIRYRPNAMGLIGVNIEDDPGIVWMESMPDCSLSHQTGRQVSRCQPPD